MPVENQHLVLVNVPWGVISEIAFTPNLAIIGFRE